MMRRSRDLWRRQRVKGGRLDDVCIDSIDVCNAMIRALLFVYSSLEMTDSIIHSYELLMLRIVGC